MSHKKHSESVGQVYGQKQDVEHQRDKPGALTDPVRKIPEWQLVATAGMTTVLGWE